MALIGLNRFSSQIQTLQDNVSTIRGDKASLPARQALREISDLFQGNLALYEPQHLSALRVALLPYQDVVVEGTLFDRIKNIFCFCFRGEPSTGETLGQTIDRQLITKDHENTITLYRKISNSVVNQTSLKKLIIEERRETPRFKLTLTDEVNFLKSLAKANHDDTLLGLLQAIQFNALEVKNLRPLDTEVRSIHDSIRLIEVGTTLTQTPNVVNEKIMQLADDRIHRLKNLETTYRELFEVNPEAYREDLPVASKYFPRTSAWFVGGSDVVGNEGATATRRLDSQMELEIQEAANYFGFRMIADIPNTSFNIKQFNQSILINYNAFKPSSFAQDFVDFSRREIRIPYTGGNLEGNQKGARTQEYEALKNAMIEDRLRRSKKWSDSKDEAGRDIRGTPYEHLRASKAVAFGLSIGAQISMNLTYNEGGNTLLGEDQEGLYAIIGNDSFAASKFIMERDLGRSMSDDEIKMAFAIDLGIPKERITFVEQPGEFHLDMSMMVIGPRKILLNQSVAAFERFQDHKARLDFQKKSGIMDTKKENETCLDVARSKQSFEDEIEESLKDAKFEVIRCPGKFFYSEHRDSQAMNFFNSVTSSNQENVNSVLALGLIDEEYQTLFKNTVISNCEKMVQAENIRFLSHEVSRKSLESSGGVSCKLKIILLP